jgi:hypothetical protein
MSETTSVQIVVSPLTRAYGKGRLKFTTVVELEIASIAITLQGVAVVSDQRGKLTVTMPQSKHPTTGVSYPAIALPIELHRCIEVEVLSLVPGSRVIVTMDAAS